MLCSSGKLLERAVWGFPVSVTFSQEAESMPVVPQWKPVLGCGRVGSGEEVYSKFVALKITCFSFIINRKHSHGRKFGKYKSLKRRK